MNLEPNAPPGIIKTDRLILRKPRIEDAESPAFTGKKNTRIRQRFGLTPRPELEEICRTLLQIVRDWQEGKGYEYAIEHAQTGELIGFISYGKFAKGFSGEAIAYDFQGAGYLSEAVLSLCNQMPNTDVQSFVADPLTLDFDNRAFRERLSERFEKTIRYRLMNRRATPRKRVPS